MEHRVIEIINTAVADARLFMDPNPAAVILQRLTEAGLVLRDVRESRRGIAWNRIGPVPPALNMTFEEEALQSIREQIQQVHLTFDRRMIPSMEDVNKQVEHRRGVLFLL